jgi:tetrahydromethanopterin S-methyltransferase subunit B
MAFLADITKLIPTVISFIKQAFSLVTNFYTEVTTLVPRSEALFDNAKAEFDKLEHFKFDPKWKSRVINVPKAEQQIRDILQIPQDLVTEFKALVADLKKKLKPTEFNLEDFRLGRFGEFLGKLLGWAQLILDSVSSISDSVDRLEHIVEDITNIREQIEKLDSLFLQQGNPRRHKRGTAVIRVGKLHQK